MGTFGPDDKAFGGQASLFHLSLPGPFLTGSIDLAGLRRIHSRFQYREYYTI